jgi:Flp pilus assembly protein TadG
VILASNIARALKPTVELAVRQDRAAQLAEFAITLPLLMVFVVGIFDFSGAYTLKQKLTNVAASAARTAAADPASDLLSPSSSEPASVIDAFDLIHNYLVANKLSDCGITLSGIPTGLTWTFSASSGGCGLTIIINRGFYFPAAAATTPAANCVSTNPAGQTAVIGTCVSIAYAYQWKFGRTASLLGFTDVLPSPLTATAVAMNEH